MTKSLTVSLTGWYGKNKRNLPWRRTRDPYKIWVSEIMLQQTTVNAVIPYYQRWFKNFPTVHALAKANIHDVLKNWQGLGYYARAKNLHKAAGLIVREHNGLLPKNPKILRTLPGFGPYSTGSVLSIAFDLPLTIIDANVRRVIMRILGIEGEADAKKDHQIEPFLQTILPQKRAGDFNQALMELGALVCRSKEPLCTLCPVRQHCKAYKEGRQEIIPTPKQRLIKDIEAVVGIIKDNKKYLIQQRPSKGLLADLWEFPGGKMEVGETKQAALKRELKEELGVTVKAAKHLFDVIHFYTQFRVKVSVFSCACDALPAAHTRRRWVSFNQLGQYPMPSGSSKIVDQLSRINY